MCIPTNIWSSRSRSALLVIEIVATIMFSSRANAGEIWMGGLARWENRKSPAIVDGAEMFNPNAPWQKVASHTKVVLFGPGNIDHATDEELKRVFNDLKSRKIGLALADAMLVRGERCRSTTEAYGNPGALARTLQKINRNGGDLKYLRMDEPFYFGHKSSDPTTCHEAVADIAAQVAVNVKLVRSIFPQAQIGDAEPVDNSVSCVEELAEWADAYREAVGEPLAFFHADTVWSEPAMQNLVPFALAMRKRKIPFGVIYNGDDTVADNDSSWTQSAVLHFTEIESALHIHPDHAIFQTWSSYPSRMLPENSAGTLTNVAFQYARAMPVLSLLQDGNTIQGQLLNDKSVPIPNAKISLQAIDNVARLAPTTRQLSGFVPANSSSAIIGIRVNTEGSVVGRGEGSATVGVIQYQENGTGVHQDVSPQAQTSKSSYIALAATFKTTANQKVSVNLKKFPVTPGANFTLAAPMSAMMNADHAGYVAVIFLDSGGKGIVRKMLKFTPSIEALGNAITDNAGRFKFKLSDTLLRAEPEIRAFYYGDNQTRAALARTTVGAVP